nr:SRPBCC family protein [uncultured Actinoplanes sp.]
MEARAHEVVIRRPVETVYRFCRDLGNAARYVGDVDRVVRLSDVAYRWHVTGAGPFATSMTVIVTADQPPHLLRYRTRGPHAVRAEWELRFLRDRPDVTRVRETLRIPLGAPGRMLLALLGKFPDAEVRRNLGQLKQVLESEP